MIGNVKRVIHGTYHRVSSKHLPRYLVEFSFRFNNRLLLNKQPNKPSSSLQVKTCLGLGEIRKSIIIVVRWFSCVVLSLLLMTTTRFPKNILLLLWLLYQPS